MKKVGRPSKLTPDVTKRFLDAVRLGSPYELACKYAGITYDTLINWRKRAENNEQDYSQFFESLSLAEGQAVIQWLAQIEKHSQADAKWAAWKLERRYPNEFGRQDKLTIDVNKLDSDIDRELAKLAAGSQAQTFGEAESETIN